MDFRFRNFDSCAAPAAGRRAGPESPTGARAIPAVAFRRLSVHLRPSPVRRPWALALPAALLSFLAGAAFVPGAAAQSVLPLDEVRAGMVGEGRTVFRGKEIETFGVEILGVLRNPFPGRSIILARLSGGPLEHTGVIQGMSGSPVTVDGRLVGAVAYAFPFSRDPICGITPFEEMVRFTEDRPGAGAGGVGGASGLSLQFSPTGIPTIHEAAASLARGPGAPPENAALPAWQSLAPTPIRTPLSVSGLDPALHGVLGPLFRQLGMELAPGGLSAGPTSTGGLPTTGLQSAGNGEAPKRPVPGSPIGATLVGGDLVLMASGTVTHVDEATGEVYAFGHPFVGLGAVAIPMQEARVEASVASLANSFKISSAGETLGVWRQDRVSGIRGELGARAPLIPLSVTVRGSRGGRREYRMELVDHDLLTPVLAFSGLMSVFSQEERVSGPQTVNLSARIRVAGGRTLTLEDVFASGLGGSLEQASALVAAPVAFLLGNPLERIPVRELEVEADAREEARTASLTRAWIESSRIRPGESVTLHLATRDYRGAERTRTIAVPIPASAAGETLDLLVADRARATAADRTEGAGSPPARVEQIFRAIDQHRRQSRLYVRLLGTGRTAAVVGGAYLPSLPPSVRSVLSRDSSGGFTRSLSHSVLWEGQLDFDAAVTGTRRLTLEVESR